MKSADIRCQGTGNNELFMDGRDLGEWYPLLSVHDLYAVMLFPTVTQLGTRSFLSLLLFNILIHIKYKTHDIFTDKQRYRRCLIQLLSKYLTWYFHYGQFY